MGKASIQSETPEKLENDKEPSLSSLVYRIICDGIYSGITNIISGPSFVGIMVSQLPEKDYVTAFGTARAYTFWLVCLSHGLLSGLNVLTARC